MSHRALLVNSEWYKGRMELEDESMRMGANFAKSH
jgi:hypothetical protein